jgi:spermidine synthase
VLVLPPTAIMGGTVPFLTRGLARLSGQVSSLHAALYAANTAGACAGALAAGFWLLPRLGLPSAVRVAAIVNLAVASCFAAFALRPGAWPDLAVPRRRPPVATPRFAAPAIRTMALLNGLAVLLLETVLLRFSALLLGGTVHAFALVVAAFVLALACGSFVVARLADIGPALLWRCQAVAVAWLVGLYAAVDVLPYYVHLLRIGFQGGASGFALFHAAVFVALLGLVLVPVGLLGTTLPLLYHELGAGVQGAGRASGTVLAWNGIGTLAGALAGSFALYDVLDLPRALLLAVAIVAGNAMLAARPAGLRARAVALSAFGLALVLLVGQPWFDGDRFAVGVYRVRGPFPHSWKGPATFFARQAAGYSVLYRDDDAVGSVAVLEHAPEGPDERPSRSLTVNGRFESNVAGDAVTLRLAAHLPALWAAERGRVLLIGLGTGVTAGQLALYDDVHTLDVAEISPAVVRCLPLFSEFTGGVEDDPRLRVRLGDAARILQRSGEAWDLVVSEPSNPWSAGADALFTREFYRSVTERLDHDGLFLQWVQLYESSFESLGMILNTVHETFPAVHAFRGSRGDLLLLAAQRPFTAQDRERAEHALAARPAVAAALAEIGITRVGDLLEREVQTLPILLQHARRFGVHTADHPRLLYLAGTAVFSGSEVTDEMLRGHVIDLAGL